MSIIAGNKLDSRLLVGGQSLWSWFSVFQKWDKSKKSAMILAFMKSVFNLCFINNDLHLLNRIQSPAEHPPIIFC
jgi:hypothetical protein